MKNELEIVTKTEVNPFHKGRLTKNLEYKGILFQQTIQIFSGGEIKQYFTCEFLSLNLFEDKGRYKAERIGVLNEGIKSIIHDKIDDILEKNELYDWFIAKGFEKHESEYVLETKSNLTKFKNSVVTFFTFKNEFLRFMLLFILLILFLIGGFSKL